MIILITYDMIIIIIYDIVQGSQAPSVLVRLRPTLLRQLDLQPQLHHTIFPWQPPYLHV